MKDTHNHRLLIGLSVLTALSLLGCSGRNDYNLPIALGMILLCTRHLSMDIFKITYILLGGTTLVDIAYLYWSKHQRHLSQGLYHYSVVITWLEIVTKIFLVGILVVRLMEYRHNSSDKAKGEEEMEEDNSQVV